ncbi:hypothetical protein [Roseibium sp. RKSG952]|uniref:hypothetical protein n=1 Tax=Roseibium sp. RKSG952 TaxID=2529384 RepID=UPI0012BCDB4C|nr:hypothetical protein [Roseibium sp. RKSG952]MTI00171.1 hypothetical protein [Roseibium sp. RKSG952]
MTILIPQVKLRSRQISLLYNERRFDELTNLYTQNAQLILPHAPIMDGSLRIYNSFATLLESGADRYTTETSDVKVFDDYALESGNFMVHDQNSKIVDLGTYQILWKNINGSLFIVRDMATSISMKLTGNRFTQDESNFINTFSEMAYSDMVSTSLKDFKNKNRE